jgi:hypothetical protein
LTVVVDANEDHTVAINHIVFFLSKALDVLPGTITYEIDNKRQDTVSARLILTDEEVIAEDISSDDDYDYDSSASTQVVGVLAVASVVLRLF